MQRLLKFERPSNSDFFDDLQRQVNQYFREKKRSKTGGAAIIWKSILLLAVFVTPFVALVVFEPTVFLAVILLVIMGVGKAGVGMSVMHDALHGSFSSHAWVNRLFGASLYLLGGNPINWKIQHNVLHHTYPNVYKADEDISTKGFVVRLSPESEHHEIHRYQLLYIFPLYAMMTLSFMVKDFRQLYRYNVSGQTRKLGYHPTAEMLKLVISKCLYLCAVIGVPVVFTGYTWVQVLVGFLIVHFTAGLILSLVFQLAHVVDRVDYPKPNEDGDFDSTWAAHQLAATANFAPDNRFIGWFTGGLNFQVEHHLFPHISHIHYRYLAPIVRETADRYGLSYNSAPTLTNALVSHTKMLKALARNKALEPA